MNVRLEIKNANVFVANGGRGEERFAGLLPLNQLLLCAPGQIRTADLLACDGF